MGKEKEKKHPKHFKYGDLVVECSRCGSRQLLAQGVENGIQMTILTNPDSYIQLVCGNSECKSKLKLFFIKGRKPKTKVEEIKDENIQEENKEEQPV